ncbi:hypothetical protein [Alteromonas sp. MmMcT2-5]|uniref:hypothetical protein n=1 Tax=Alteromonas sp. MmMcT2-5 TaxID=2917733 RepID=UPI001EF3AB24|nr:hypothetical protein [Alteromonas sp. MmMcT2-5]MCG7651825.1 hypothetical protein [Alteromonas sp. MmMcT2-5]
MPQYQRREDIRLQRTSNKFVQVKREVTKVESYTEAMGGELLLQLGNAQLSVPININPHWVATVMEALSE